ncbi:MAG: hypothetical protein Q4C82_02195 [Eubacteriales bacterium]|nr:hypothetical protein [Eubacteriales bacterium]
MESGENLKRQDRPSVLQLRYLAELDHMEKKRGVQGMVAARCGVNASTVNRYFKACMEKGYLDESCGFTDKGRRWFEHYRKLQSRLERYLKELLGRDSEVQEAVRSLIENTDSHVLEAILSSHERQNMLSAKRSVELPDNLREMLRRHRRHEVRFGIYRMGREQRPGRLSMAMRGFREDAYLTEEEGEAYLELYVREVTAASRIDGKTMEGRLDSLKYEDGDTLQNLRIEKEKIQIPLSAFKIYHGQGGRIKGTLAITVTCSVGQAHMPESTAFLVFWL